MCGIAGVLDFGNKKVEKDIVQKMVSIQRHRGPDGEGFYFGENIGLGHARLAIIDLSKNADQPMANEDNTKWIIHTGEIYNYLELKKELTELGHTFKSASDTEVILHAFEEWGEGALNRFNGMWAFAIWDTKKHQLFVSRDRFGIKPFYYFFDGEHFIFASEIKALLLHPLVKKAPNEQTIYNYLSTGYGYTDMSKDTFFDGIERLKEGHYILLRDGKFTTRCYWDITTKKDNSGKDLRELVEEFHVIFEDAIRLRLRGEAEIGIALSGGLDSSAIACTISRLTGRKLKAFSSYFKEKQYDDKKFVESVLEVTGFKGNFTFPDTRNIFKALRPIIWHQDEPALGLDIYSHWNVFETAKKHGVKVVLSGQGGDEALAGYLKYYPYFFADLIKKNKIPTLFKELKCYPGLARRAKPKVIGEALYILASSFVPGKLKDFRKLLCRNQIPYLNQNFTGEHDKGLFGGFKFNEILNNALYNAFKISPLPSLLRIDDKNGMAHSIELRSPFLDYRLVEFLFSIPSAYKIKDGYTKYFLRESMKDILPEINCWRKEKRSFSGPERFWFRDQLKNETSKIFKSKSFSDRGYFNVQKVNEMFSAHVEGRGDFKSEIWSLLNLELWFRTFIDS